jgi:hypothetical protein
VAVVFVGQGQSFRLRDVPFGRGFKKDVAPVSGVRLSYVPSNPRMIHFRPMLRFQLLAHLVTNVVGCQNHTSRPHLQVQLISSSYSTYYTPQSRGL